MDNEIEQVKIDTENFSKQVDAYVSGNFKTWNFINVGHTPKIL